MSPKCPKCNNQVGKPNKEWKYRTFTVQAYICGNCNTQFREYIKDGKHAFTLKLENGKGYVKA